MTYVDAALLNLVELVVSMFCTAVLYLLTQTVFKDSIEIHESNAYRRVVKGMRYATAPERAPTSVELRAL